MHDTLETLVAAAQQKQARQRDQAAAEYRQIIARADKPDAGDADRVVELIATLGCAVEQFTADVDAGRQHASATAALVPAAVAANLGAKVTETHAAAETYEREARDKLEQLRAVASEASRALAASNQRHSAAEAKLRDLAQRHPHLFPVTTPS
ncbi:MAG TPA: hypothetical protein VF624_03805 [Tepidisphaeraceae bacterium]|jgi:hypothetical protein